MIVGYARTSTLEQTAGLEAQVRDLSAAGCERIFSEQVSGVDSGRPELANATRFLREGDTLVVTSLCRLARSMHDLQRIVADLEGRKIALRIIGMGIDTASAHGKLIVNLLGSIAEFERSIMLSRQREGIAKAKAAGRYRGRAPTARRQAQTVLELHRSGTRPSDIARRIGIGRSSVYRILREADGKEAKTAAAS